MDGDTEEIALSIEESERQIRRCITRLVKQHGTWEGDLAAFAAELRPMLRSH